MSGTKIKRLTDELAQTNEAFSKVCEVLGLQAGPLTYLDVQARLSREPAFDPAHLRETLRKLFTFLNDCWIGTGSSYEEGSASNDYRLWRDRIYTELRLLDK